MSSQGLGVLSYILRTSPVYVAVFLMRFSFAFTVVALQFLLPVPVERGVVASAYPLMEMITGLFFGLLTDKIGRKSIIVGSLLASSVITFSFTLTKSFPLFVVIHGLQGICAAAIITTTLASLTDLSKKESRGREMGFYDFCTIGGYGLGFVFALILIGGKTQNDLLPFYAGAIIALVGAAVSAALLKDESKVHTAAVSVATLTNNIRDILSSKKSLTLIATWFVLTILIGVGLTYTRELLSVLFASRSLGLLAGTAGASGQPTKIGLLIAAFLVIGVLLLGFSQTSLGSLSDKFGREKVVFIGQVSILGLLIVLVSLFAFHLNKFVALPFLVIFGIGLLSFTPAGLAALADIAPDYGRGSTMGLYSLTVGAGTVFAPLAGGALISIYGAAIGFSILFSIGVLIMVGVVAAMTSDFFRTYA